MYNFKDVNILGVAKDQNSVTYSVVEVTREIKKQLNLANDLIVIGYQLDEYLTLYKVSDNQELEDIRIYGVRVNYDNGIMNIGEMEELFAIV